MTELEMRQLQELGGQARYLAYQFHGGHISEGEYIDRLNALRLEMGLAPVEVSSNSSPVDRFPREGDVWR